MFVWPCFTTKVIFNWWKRWRFCGWLINGRTYNNGALTYTVAWPTKFGWRSLVQPGKLVMKHGWLWATHSFLQGTSFIHGRRLCIFLASLWEGTVPPLNIQACEGVVNFFFGLPSFESKKISQPKCNVNGTRLPFHFFQKAIIAYRHIDYIIDVPSPQLRWEA